jgi:hypothetical protein
MAKKKNMGSSTFKSQGTFDQSLVTDTSDFHLPENSWTYARNAINNTRKGDIGKLSTEPANHLCTFAPYTIIGAIHIEEDRWLIFSTNNTSSEIGIFKEDNCSYTTVVNDACLNFNSDNLIKGIIKPSFDCSFNAYWDDGINVSRVLDIGNVPWIQTCVTTNGCTVCTDTTDLDCDKIRLESFVQTPCVKLSKGKGVGSILNGTYQAQISYLIDQQRVTDYFTPSNALTLFDHTNVNSSIDINISNLDTNFDDYELVLISTINEKTVARQIGIYSTRQTIVSIDYIDITLSTVPVANLTVLTPVPDKSEAIFGVGNYALRVGPTTKFDFNYQPLANQIETFWQSVEYNTEYYKNGGINIGYMRDEVYGFFIRWVYNTGDKSSSYHIPGRAANQFYLTNDAGGNAGLINEDALCPTTINDIESPVYTPKVFEVYNTATLTSTPNTTLADGGVLIAEGKMGYWESIELYDDNNPIVWNSNLVNRPELNLCGQPIRHHKFPENVLSSGGSNNTITNHYADGGNKIRVMGIRFDNILPPVDNNGNPITNIVGYEILRSNRTGSKSVLYKGLINNMFEYNAPNLITTKRALYANYPFNDLRPDPFISSNILPTSYEPLQSPSLQNYTPNADYSKKHFTFHSPDTMFARPFLVDDEVKIYGAAWGESQGYFKEVDNHPKHKFVTDISFLASVIIGFGYAISKLLGTRDIKYTGYKIDSDAIFLGTGSNSLGNVVPVGTVLTAAQATANNTIGLQGMVDGLSGQNLGLGSVTAVSQNALIAASKGAAQVPSTGVTSGHLEITYKDQDSNPGILKAAVFLLGNPMFKSYLAEGTDTTLKLIQSLGAWQQFALQYQSICKYENFAPPYANNRRRRVNDARYLNPGVQDYQTNYIINHTYRNETVVFDTDVDVENITGTITDVSRPSRISALAPDDRFATLNRRASSHYVALKTRLRNQYGQLQSIRQLLATSCVLPIQSTNSGTIFGGDIYIGKYSEKNTLYYFQQWLDSQPNGYAFNYNKQKMFEWTAFWMDTDSYDMLEFTNSIPDALQNALNGGGINGFLQTLVTPSDKHCFDRLPGNTTLGIPNNGLFLLKQAFMYLFNSGVRDFFVESEFNIDMRDWQDTDSKKHYPILSDLKTMFNLNLIKADNYYQIDRSLTHSFMASQKIPWGTMQSRDYNPLLSASCYTKYPRRLLYSLPQEAAQQNVSLLKKDSWRVFLPNNYADYTSNVVSIKPIDKTAALILFENQAPGMLPGVDELQTKGAANITIGDGRLFDRKLQQLSNSEESFEYASCQSRLSVLNTPAGVFWMNLNQGKIFCYAGGLKEISLKGNKFWLNTYLPYKLLEDFPTYSVTDNPVAGIGCQTIYDNEYSLIYFCKKDYRLKKDLPVTVQYLGGSKFLINNVFIAKTGDPLYFDDCSWTLSYDPKIEQFVSFHDWHPDLSLGAKNTFLTTKDNSFWKHNEICSLYCNYYGKDYPFEVEFQLDNKFSVATMRNVEYYIESFVYDTHNCYDRFHVLDYGFNEAIVYNSEQVSGVLKLNITPKNDIPLLLSYPSIETNYVDILFSKEEQQYRFNQFCDITNDRGEYSGVEELIWNTEDNGYIRNLNPVNLNYNKQDFQRKKFRHYNNKVILKRTVNNNVEIQVSLAASNQQLSHR